MAQVFPFVPSAKSFCNYLVDFSTNISLKCLSTFLLDYLVDWVRAFSFSNILYFWYCSLPKDKCWYYPSPMDKCSRVLIEQIISDTLHDFVILYKLSLVFSANVFVFFEKHLLSCAMPSNASISAPLSWHSLHQNFADICLYFFADLWNIHCKIYKTAFKVITDLAWICLGLKSIWWQKYPRSRSKDIETRQQ